MTQPQQTIEQTIDAFHDAVKQNLFSIDPTLHAVGMLDGMALCLRHPIWAKQMIAVAKAYETELDPRAVPDPTQYDSVVAQVPFLQ